MTTLPPSPFMNSVAAEPSAADRAVATHQPREATARFDRYFDPEKFLRDIALMKTYAHAIQDTTLTDGLFDTPATRAEGAIRKIKGLE